MHRVRTGADFEQSESTGNFQTMQRMEMEVWDKMQLVQNIQNEKARLCTNYKNLMDDNDNCDDYTVRIILGA